MINPLEDKKLHREIVHVWAIAWPLILTNMLNVTVGIIDFKMVGMLGVESIAAVGMSRQVMMILLVLMIAISGGSSVLVAHAHGAGDRKRVAEVAARSVLFMLLGAMLIVTPIGLLISKPTLVLLGGEESVVRLGSAYLRILFFGSVFTMFNFAINGALLGVGKTKVSLVVLIGVNLCNVLFNYLFIFGIGPFPAMGVAGAALGTVLSRCLGSIAGIWILVSPRFPIQMRFKDGFDFDFHLLRKILYLGGPRSMQGIVRNFSRLMTLRIITLLPDPTRVVSAYSVGMQVRMISSFVGLAFMASSMTRVGQNMGAKKPEMAERSGWISAGMAAGLMTIVAFVFFFFPESIMGFFTDDREVIAMGKGFFIAIALTEPIMAFGFALGGALRGGGDPMSPFIYASVSDFLTVLGGGYLLAVQFNMGFIGIAIAIALSSFTRAIPTTWKFHQGHWKKNRL